MVGTRVLKFSNVQKVGIRRRLYRGIQRHAPPDQPPEKSYIPSPVSSFRSQFKTIIKGLRLSLKTTSKYSKEIVNSGYQKIPKRLLKCLSPQGPWGLSLFNRSERPFREAYVQGCVTTLILYSEIDAPKASKNMLMLCPAHLILSKLGLQ